MAASSPNARRKQEHSPLRDPNTRRLPSPMPPSTATPAIDLDALLQRCLGNLDLAERAIEAFLDDFPTSHSNLEQAIELDDSEAVSQLAHRMKGAARNVGAESLAGLLESMESLSAEGDREQKRELAATIADELKRLEESVL